MYSQRERSNFKQTDMCTTIADHQGEPGRAVSTFSPWFLKRDAMQSAKLLLQVVHLSVCDIELLWSWVSWKTILHLPVS